MANVFNVVNLLNNNVLLQDLHVFGLKICVFLVNSLIILNVLKVLYIEHGVKKDVYSVGNKKIVMDIVN